MREKTHYMESFKEQMAQSHKIAAEISNIKIDGIEVYKAFLYMRQVTANATISILRLRMALCKRKGTVKSPFVLKDIARRCAKVAAFLCCTTVALAQQDSINFPLTTQGLTWDTTNGDARRVFIERPFFFDSLQYEMGERETRFGMRDRLGEVSFSSDIILIRDAKTGMSEEITPIFPKVAQRIVANAILSTFETQRRLAEAEKKIAFYERYFGRIVGDTNGCIEFEPVLDPPVMPPCNKKK